MMNIYVVIALLYLVCLFLLSLLMIVTFIYLFRDDNDK